LVAGEFDPESVMLYRFAPFFYNTRPSPCAPTSEGINLSDGDKRGLALLYPHAADDLRARERRAKEALRSSELESYGAASVFEARYVELLVERAGPQ
jgi:hypothetical protein